jgi:hypothetical protein
MSVESNQTRGFPAAAAILLVFAAAMYAFTLYEAQQAPHLDAVGRMFATIFSVPAAIVLWILLGVVLMIGIGSGDMPSWAVATVVILHVVWGGTMITALFQLPFSASPPPSSLAVLAGPPVLFAGYAFWARFPGFASRGWAHGVSAVALAPVLILCAGHLAYTFGPG